ncbi:hypothetical protein SAMN05428949_6512 [Chitinophaga sp. YR627]|uniref:hypothetical protein n=1 Tax=Chitinophaga sp. YR627 TaxID=1881041 RepID=UPI0008E47ABF|nr:hypothetical protein [Chitinophaga sp. YR627]SFO75822.1 hypothetical protein SAMN05428949_6512 [Chitinophaga sp. YR627]
MARQNSLITFTGKLGNIIGYERNGKYFLRSAPEKVRQTPATRRAARRFGMISRKAALIRKAIYGEMDILCDSGHINRLNRTLIKSAGDHTAINGFRFNEHAGIDRFLSMAPRLFRNGILHFPAQSLLQHRDILSLEITVIVTHIDFKHDKVLHTETITMTVDNREDFKGMDVPLEMSHAGTRIVTLQVRGMHKDGPARNKSFFAADIIAVKEAQIPVFFSKQSIPQQAFPDRGGPMGDVCKAAVLTVIKRE